MTYKPLPAYLTIKPSKINGLGLFTLTDIDKGVNLGMSHIIDTPTLDTIRTPLGGFINHSEEANCEWRQIDDIIKVRTIKDVPEGTELTLKYKWYNPNE